MTTPFISTLFGHYTPLYLQSTVAECGLACLGMVASTHGYALSLRELRSKYPVSLHGMSVKRLAEVGARMGLSARPVKLEVEELRNLRLPAVLQKVLSIQLGKRNECGNPALNSSYRVLQSEISACAEMTT